MEEDTADLIYDINLCGICQFSDNFNLTSFLEEQISEHGTTYLDLLKYIFPEVEWLIIENITPLICQVCLETIKEIVDFKKICIDMNRRRAFDKFPNISVREQIKIEIVSDDNEESSITNGKREAKTTTKTIEIISEGHNVVKNQEMTFKVEETFGTDNYYVHSVEFPDDSEVFDKVGEQAIKRNDCETSISDREDADVVDEDLNLEVENNNVAQVQKDGQIKEEVDDVIKPIKKNSIYKAKFTTQKDDRHCKECKERFKTRKELDDHIGTKHLVLRKFRCHTCLIGFSCRDALYRHMYKHNGVRNYVCTVCGRKYITQGDLTEHIKYHQTEAKHVCDVCGARFKTVSNLRTHLVVHDEPKDYRFLCVMCGNKYSSTGALADHILHRHNTGSIPCTKCSKKFHSQRDLTRHMVKHSDVQNFACKMCDKRFKRSHMLSIHMTKQHGIGRYKYLTEKKHECGICRLKLATRPKLLRHMRTHTGVRPFKCRLCHKRFICSSYIKGHLKQKHDINVDAVDYVTADYYDVDEIESHQTK